MSTSSNLLKAAIDSIQAPFPRSNFRVFVLGPALNVDVTVAKPASSPSTHDSILEHARYLRSLTKVRLSQLGYPVDFGETKELLRLWSNRFRASDPGSAEILHARKVSGAIIVYPSSIGSISELGMFAPYGDIAEKILAIVHKSYENDNSFFRKALLEVLRQEKGSREFIDYADEQACINAAVEFVDGQYQKLLRDYIEIESGKLREAKLGGTLFEKKS